MTSMTIPRVGPGIARASLILAAVAFITIFSALAGSFDYPDILDRPAAEVLPRILALSDSGCAIWAFSACIPLC